MHSQKSNAMACIITNFVLPDIRDCASEMEEGAGLTGLSIEDRVRAARAKADWLNRLQAMSLS